jgi:hypothetical protein
MHGGAAPQVKRSAALRLAALVDPAIGVIAKALKDGKIAPETRVRTAFGVLDRNGYKPTDVVRLEGGENIGVNSDTSKQRVLGRIAGILERRRAGGSP